MKKFCILSLILFGVGFSNICVQAAGTLDITRVSVDKKLFNPTEDKEVNISFEITADADINLTIYDVLGRSIRSFALPGSKAGRHSIIWDGRTNDNGLAAGELFLYVIKATVKDGRSIVYNRAKETGGMEVRSLEYTLDRDTGKIEYVLPKTCMIRIRAGLKDGMFAKTVVDWEPRLPGRQSFIWDGKDESGFMYLLKHPELDLRLTCYTLPDNVIIVKNKTVLPASNSNDIDEEKLSRDEVWATKGKYQHYRHDPRICHVPGFKVLFPSAPKQDVNDAPVVSGVVPIRVVLDEKDRQHLISTRFEVMFFVDGVYIYEVEEGTTPFTFHWDTKDFSKGPHIVTINIIGYDDHIGIVSKKIILGE